MIVMRQSNFIFFQKKLENLAKVPVMVLSPFHIVVVGEGLERRCRQ